VMKPCKLDPWFDDDQSGLLSCFMRASKFNGFAKHKGKQDSQSHHWKDLFVSLWVTDEGLHDRGYLVH
jgi:hypothetical protein